MAYIGVAGKVAMKEKYGGQCLIWVEFSFDMDSLTFALSYLW